MRKTKAERKRSRRLRKIGISLLFVSSFLVTSSCSRYDPNLYPGYDVLRPSATVEIIAFTEDGNVIVSPDFMLWVDDLKAEISRLRKLIK